MRASTARKYLPEKYKSMTDEEILQLIAQLEEFADLMIDEFSDDGSKKQLGVIDSSVRSDDNGN